jgi:hypothetical protein
MSSSDRNQTVHDARRELAPEPEPEQKGRSRRRTIATIVLGVAGSLVAGYGVASLLGGTDPAPSAAKTAGTTPAGGSRTTPRVAAGTLSATTPAPAAPGVPAPALTAPDPSATPPAATPATPPAAPSAAGSFDAPIPKGWREREFATQQQGYLQSRWDDPRDARTFVVIDWIDGDRRLPADAAAALRAGVASRPDYREVRFTQTRDRGWIWVYTLLDEQRRRAARIDLISRRCGVLFAVLGSTSPKRFAALQPTFVAISRGIRIKSRRC